MKERQWARRRSTLFVGTLLVCLALWYWLPTSFLQPFRNVMVTVTLPVATFFSWSAFELREIGDFWGSVRDLKSENERLTRELMVLKADHAALISLREENIALRREVDLEVDTERTLVVGAVIAENERSALATIRINRGSRQGIQEGMAVVSSGTVLVGRVESVTPFAAEVRLLSHRESIVAGIVDGAAGQLIVRGDHGVGMLLDLARSDDTLPSGASVVTAGLGHEIPAGLLIGTVGATRPSPDQLFQQAVLMPPLRADELRFVSVITDF